MIFETTPREKNEWMRKEFVYEPGAYWVADIRGGKNKPPHLFVVNLLLDKENNLYVFNRDFPGRRYLAQWDNGHRLMGPLEIPQSDPRGE